MNLYFGTLTFMQWSKESKNSLETSKFMSLKVMITKFCSLAALTKTEDIADLTFQNLDTSCLIVLRSKADSGRSIGINWINWEERGLVIEDMYSASFEIIGSGNAPSNFT